MLESKDMITLTPIISSGPELILPNHAPTLIDSASALRGTGKVER